MQLVLGEQAAVKMSNSGRNTDAGRTVFIQGVFHKRGQWSELIPLENSVESTGAANLH